MKNPDHLRTLLASGRRFIGPALFLTVLFVGSAYSEPLISNVSVAQREGTKLVDINYDLAGGTPTSTVTLSVSDGGTPIAATSVTGDVGAEIADGSGRAIVWDGGADADDLLASLTFSLLAVGEGGSSPSTDMVFVEGGTLPASSQLGEVAVDPFYMGQYEVTWGEWQAVRTWAELNGYDFSPLISGCADDHPVRSVRWYDAVKWCNAKSEKDGLAAVYSVSGAIYRSGEPDHTTITQDLTASGYRLPTEAEWEFAARGGNQTNGYTYAGSNDLNAVGWYRDNSSGAPCDLLSGRGTWPVGQKAANELGLYDMSGNIEEWVFDLGSDGSGRRYRGGGWLSQAVFHTFSYRGELNPDANSSTTGFRVARSFPPTMVLVEGGTLPDSSELGEVAVDTFYMGQYEVSWGEWQAVRTWAELNGYDFSPLISGCADDHPVRNVRWYDAVKWCNAKSEKDGLAAVYSVSGAIYRSGEPDHTTITQDLTASGYRLPTEAEWEFAARGGNQTNGYTYSGSNDMNAVGWYLDNSSGAACDLLSGRGTWPVGQKAANELGLYDMSGNIAEWVFDLGSNSHERRLRGGYWFGQAAFHTVSYRLAQLPQVNSITQGFRVALSSGN